MIPSKIELTDDTHIFVLTGAGISADSGIATFRDSNGLWNDHKIEDVATPEGWRKDPSLVWKFYSQRRREVAQAKPNHAHKLLVGLEQKLGDRFCMYTQNIDGLHTRAGSKNIHEMHGNLFRSKCDGALCSHKFNDRNEYADIADVWCTECWAGMYRPDVVWFGENLADDAMTSFRTFCEKAKGAPFYFISIGTSGNVYPAAGMVCTAKVHGANSISINKHDEFYQFDQNIIATASGGLISLFGDLCILR